MTQLCWTWQNDIPGLVAEEWEEDIQQFIPMMFSARDGLIQLKFLYRANYTPQKLLCTLGSTSPALGVERRWAHSYGLVLPSNPIGKGGWWRSWALLCNNGSPWILLFYYWGWVPKWRFPFINGAFFSIQRFMHENLSYLNGRHLWPPGFGRGESWWTRCFPFINWYIRVGPARKNSIQSLPCIPFPSPPTDLVPTPPSPLRAKLDGVPELSTLNFECLVMELNYLPLDEFFYMLYMVLSYIGRCHML